MPQLQHSEEINEVMGRIPSWIVRWGIGIIFLILGGVIIWSYFFPLPETVSAPIVLSSNVTPVAVAAPSAGYIDTLFVHTGDMVQKGTTIAQMCSVVDYESEGDLSEVWVGKTYLLRSPKAGRITLLTHQAEIVSENQTVALIIPHLEKDPEVYGIMIVTGNEYRKIELGLKVRVKLTDIQGLEDNKLFGYVKAIYPAPDREGYMVDVAFQQDMPIRVNDILSRTRHISGQAEIIIAQKRASERLMRIGK